MAEGVSCQSEIQGFWLKKQSHVERNINGKPELLTHDWRTCSFSEMERGITIERKVIIIMMLSFITMFRDPARQ